MVVDPVCLNMINEQEANLKFDFRGNTYYFDSDRCKHVFEQDPSQYAALSAELEYGDFGQRFPEK